MDTLMRDSVTGVYRDYNDKTGKQSPVISAASFQPYFAGVAGEEQKNGLKKLLSVLEGEFGVFTTEVQRTYGRDRRRIGIRHARNARLDGWRIFERKKL